MSHWFTLEAQRCGPERHVTATLDGFGGITVDRDGDMAHVRSRSEAIRIARDYTGEFLRPAKRGGQPWGLRVQVADGWAVYGEWPVAGAGGGSPSFRSTPLVRIRNRWHDSGPLSALENAIQIIREYAPQGRRAA